MDPIFTTERDTPGYGFFLGKPFMDFNYVSVRFGNILVGGQIVRFLNLRIAAKFENVRGV